MEPLSGKYWMSTMHLAKVHGSKNTKIPSWPLSAQCLAEELIDKIDYLDKQFPPSQLTFKRTEFLSVAWLKVKKEKQLHNQTSNLEYHQLNLIVVLR